MHLHQLTNLMLLMSIKKEKSILTPNKPDAADVIMILVF